MQVLLAGYPDGTFKPLQPVTRAETVVIMQRALEAKKAPEKPITPSSIEVSVTANGKAVDKATVDIFIDGKYEVFKTGNTDSNGIFQLELSEGTYNITVIKGKQIGFADKVTIEDQGKTTAQIKLTAGVEIQGTMLDSKNNAIKNTEIVFTTNPTFVAKTDSAGKYKVVLLPNHKYIIQAFNPNKRSEGLKIIASDLVIGSKDEIIKDLIAPFAITTSAGGGGGGGGGGTVTESKVSTAKELDSALKNSNITSIAFIKDITASPTVTRSLTIDFGVYTLTGDLIFDHNVTGTSVLKGQGGTRITGDLIVNTPKASFKNGVTVGGKVNIANVLPNSWTEKADGNTLTITVPGGATITVTGSPNSVTVTEDAGGNLIITVSPGAVIDNITTNVPINIQVVAGATVNTITVEEDAGSTVIINNGTLGTLAVHAPIELVANVAPSDVTVGEKGSLDVSGPDAGNVPGIVSAIIVTGAGDAITIDVDGGTLQMSVAVSPDSASNKSVTWSVTNVDGTATDKATISETGLLTAVANGTVTVRATSVSTPSVSGTAVITISNQETVIPDPAVSGSISRGDSTGGDLTFNVEGDTIKFTAGEIKWYEADASVGRNEAGNRVGVKISAPADFDTKDVKVTIGTTEYDWETIKDGDNYFLWYPLVTEANKVFTATVVWNGSSTQVFTVDTTGTSLEAAPVVLDSTIAQDPGNTGGAATVTVEGKTITFSGEIAYYEAAAGFPPVAGNYVGVEVTAPTGITPGIESTLTIGETTYTSWENFGDGDTFFWYYPRVTAAGDEFTFAVSWDGTDATTETFTIKIASDATLEAAAPAATPVAVDRVSQFNTFVEGVELEVTEAGKAKFTFGDTVNWPSDQEPNEEMGADPELVYVDVLVKAPEGATKVLIGENIVPLDNEINGTTEEGRLHYFPVAQEDGNGDYVGFADAKTWQLTYKWYNDSDELIAVETLEVTREAYVAEPAATPVATDRIGQYNTYVDGVTLEVTEAGKAKFTFGDTVNWPSDQEPNEEMGADPELVYVDVLVKAPEGATKVLIGENIVPLDNEINGTTEEGRLHYFPVAQEDGNGDYVGFADAKTWELTYKWYNDSDELIAVETLEVTREEYVNA